MNRAQSVRALLSLALAAVVGIACLDVRTLFGLHVTDGSTLIEQAGRSLNASTGVLPAAQGRRGHIDRHMQSLSASTGPTSAQRAYRRNLSALESPSSEAANPSSNGMANATEKYRPEESYWKLSCSLEWSKYSCATQGAEKNQQAERAFDFAWTGNNLDNARAARKLANEGLFDGRRVLIVGDSMTRQIFISLGCLLDNLVVDRRVGWVSEGWPCSTKNCITKNGHSGFDKAALLLKNGGELHFFSHRGSFQGKTEETAAMSRIHREHTLTGMVNFGRYAVPFAGSPAILGSDDVLVVNAGIHFNSHDENCLGAAQIASFGADLVADPVALRTIYLATPSQNFETEDGAFNGQRSRLRYFLALVPPTRPRNGRPKLDPLELSPRSPLYENPHLMAFSPGSISSGALTAECRSSPSGFRLRSSAFLVFL